MIQLASQSLHGGFPGIHRNDPRTGAAALCQFNRYESGTGADIKNRATLLQLDVLEQHQAERCRPQRQLVIEIAELRRVVINLCEKRHSETPRVTYRMAI